MAGLQRQGPFEHELESVELVDLLADLAEAERPHERQRGGVARTDRRTQTRASPVANAQPVRPAIASRA
jgi:hypothetical protein